MGEPVTLWMVQYWDYVYLFKDAYNALCKFNAFAFDKRFEFRELCECDDEMTQYLMYDKMEKDEHYLTLMRVHTQDDKDNSQAF